MGDFGVTHKIPAFYECLIRVPMVMWDPTGRVPRGVHEGMAELMDGMATILDLCGLAQPEGSHARSLAGASAVRRDIYADAGMLVRQPLQPVPGHVIKAAMPPTAFGPGAMLRTTDWKLCVYGEDRGELFDLSRDRYETTNLFDAPTHVQIKADLMQRLNQRMMCFGRMPECLPAVDV